MSANLVKLLSEGKTYLWALRHCQQPDLTEAKVREIRDVLAADGIDLATLMALHKLEYPIAKFPHPSKQRIHHREYYFFPIPTFEIEIYFKTIICEHGLELGTELFPGLVSWQFGHDEIQYCIGGDTPVEMIHANNTVRKANVKAGDVVAVPNGTNFVTHSTEKGKKYGHAHIFLCNIGEQTGQVFYDVGGLLRLQSLGMVEPSPPGALPFDDITERIEIHNLEDLLVVDKKRERDLPTWLRNGWKRRVETRMLDYIEGTPTTVVSSPDRKVGDFIEWGKNVGKYNQGKCFVNPIVAEQTAAITDCRFPVGYKRLHPHKEIWVVLKGQAKVKQSVPPLHSVWVEYDLKMNDVMVAGNGAHFHVLEATQDFVVRRLAESGAHNSHAAMMEMKLKLDGVHKNV
jgi:mannose-6-phosphate isomerase-like protein (cupin superfamily)